MRCLTKLTLRATPGLKLVGIIGILAFSALVTNAAAPDIGVRDVGSLRTKLCNVFNAGFDILLVIAAIMVLVGAYVYLTAGGDAEKVKTATKILTYTAVAIVVALLAKAFPWIITNLFGGGRGGC